MRKIFVLLPLVFMLAACGEESKIKDAVRNSLKDPGSAQFKDAIISAKKNMACITWNAKNSMGGYGNWSTAELAKEDSEWIVQEMQGNPDNCTQDHFLIENAKLEAIDLLQKAKNISKTEAVELAENQCRSLVNTYIFAVKIDSMGPNAFKLTKDYEDFHSHTLPEYRSRVEKGQCENSKLGN